jgi:2-methylisocitrate lyase-like PEP mutase family enzyme
MSFDDVLGRVEQITAAVDVPVSVDVESGYGLPASRLIDGLLGAAAADQAGVHLVINARTDLFLRKDGDNSDRVERAVAGRRADQLRAIPAGGLGNPG